MARLPTPLVRIAKAVAYKAEVALERFVGEAERKRHDPHFDRERASQIEPFEPFDPRYRHDLLINVSMPLAEAFQGEPKGPRPPGKEFVDIPLQVWADWNVRAARNALSNFAVGMFGMSGLLVESMLGDDRVQTAFNGFVKNITKCEPLIVPADDPDGEDLAIELESVWEDILDEAQVEQIFQWSRFVGFALAEIIWEAYENQNRWLPRLKVWHPYYVYYNIAIRKYVALTMEGQVEIDPDDPKWFLFTPYGSYRGWLRGAVRAIATPWLVRQFALRDWARFSEVHGLPIRIAKVPAQAPAEDKARFFASVRNLGAESVMMLPVQAGPDAAAWDAKLLEASDRSWEAFPGLRDACDQAITLAIRGTNLTTSVGQGNSGNRAAAEVHRDEDQDYALSERRKFASALRRHLFRFYAIFNYGKTSCVPKKVSLVDPDRSDVKGELEAMRTSADVVAALRQQGAPVDETEIYERANVPLKPIEDRAVNDDSPKVAISVEDVGVVVKVDEARSSMGLDPLGGEVGELTIEEARQKAKPEPKSPFGGAESGDPKPIEAESSASPEPT